jgi:pimeloyl-ACP methyl ester carboxylesterase
MAQSATLRERVACTDHFVPHVSSVPAIAGEVTKIFVREKRLADAPAGPPVLMVHGGISHGTLAFDLQHASYSWMDDLARGGFTAYALDMTGYGRSARPMMGDPLNLPPAQRKEIGLSSDAPAPYPFELVSSRSEWDEIDCVVAFIRARHGGDPINLLGWSGGGKRSGSYASLYPEKVARLVIFASSNYASDGPDAPPATLPRPGFAMTIQSRRLAEEKRWNPYLRCPGQIDPAMKDVVWRTMMESDPVGASWGSGVMRAPVRTYWGWNRQAARRIAAPTLIMIGAFDDLLASNRALYGDLAVADKAMLEIDCGSHFMLWETQHRVLHQAAREWFSAGTLLGRRHGLFGADAQGRIAAP